MPGIDSAAGTDTPPPPESLERTVHARKLDILYTNLPGGLAVNAVVATTVAALLSPSAPPRFLAVWLAAAYLLAAYRYFDLRRHRRRPDGDLSALRGETVRFHLCAGLQGSLWGSAGFALIPGLSTVDQLFVTLVFSAMAGGGVIYLAAIPSVYFGFLAPTLLPSCMRLLQGAEVAQRSAGLLGLVYALAMGFAAVRTGRWIDGSIRALLRNQALTARERKLNRELEGYREHLEGLVGARTRELTDANSRLSAEIANVEASRREAERVRRRFRELADMLPEVVFELDRNLGVTYLNRKYHDLTGRPAGDAVTAGEELVAEEERGRFRAFLREVLAGNQEPPRMFGCTRADGSTFPVMVACAVTRRDGAAHGVRGLAIDMSQRQELERRVRETTKMEALGTLAGGVAHDFNNILSIVLGQAEVLLAQDDLDVDTSTRVRRIVAASEQAKHLVRQILTFARRQEQERVPVDATGATTAALDLVEAALPRGVNLVRQLDAPGTAILGDPTELQQVVLNLCTNAVQAMAAAGGTLTVGLNRVAAASITEAAPAGQVELSVSDTGPGIPAAVRARLFDPFFTTKPAGEGTGMGLAVVHGVVTRCGGEVLVDAGSGPGVTFRVRLPLLAAGRVAAAPDRPTAPAAGDEAVLVVDDDDNVREAVADSLQVYGYRASGVASSKEALARLADGRFAAVVTDYNMPHSTGTELAEELQRRFPAPPPVILYTGDTSAVPADAVTSGAVAAVLQKPTRARDLANAVRRAVDGAG